MRRRRGAVLGQLYTGWRRRTIANTPDSLVVLGGRFVCCQSSCTLKLFAPLVVLGGKLREAKKLTVVINLRPLVHLAHVAERS